jgi:hypothetical protein
MVFPEHGPGLACGGGCKTTGWCVTTPWSWSRPRAPASCKCLGMQLTKTFPHNIALNQHSSILAGVLNRLHHVHDQERASLALGMVKTWRRGPPPLIGRWVMLYCVEFIEFAICDQQLGHQINPNQTTSNNILLIHLQRGLGKVYHIGWWHPRFLFLDAKSVYPTLHQWLHILVF